MIIYCNTMIYYNASLHGRMKRMEIMAGMFGEEAPKSKNYL